MTLGALPPSYQEVEVKGRAQAIADSGAAGGEGASEEKSRRASLVGGVAGERAPPPRRPRVFTSAAAEGVQGGWGHTGPRVLALRRWG